MASSRISKSNTFSSGPAWAAYTAYTVLGTVVAIPAYLAYFAVPSLRARPAWTFYTALSNHMNRIAFDYIAVSEYAMAQIDSVKPGLGAFTWLEPGPSALYAGLLQDANIQPKQVGGVWVPETPGGADAVPPAGRPIVLHMHGGAYVTLSPGLGPVQAGPRLLAKELGASVLMVDYRLSCNANARHPAALQDAISAYKALLDQGYNASQILLSGDSAGGHLVLMLLRHVAEHGLLPAPKGAALWSPWTDMEMTSTRNDAEEHRASDYVTDAILAWGLREFLPLGSSSDAPYFSPARHPFKTATKLFIQSSNAETLQPQAIKARDAFSAIPGNQVGYTEAADCPHDVFAAGDGLGLAREQLAVTKEAIAYLWP